MQFLLFTPRMVPLAHIHTYVANTAAQGWSNRDSVSTASFVRPILNKLSLAARRQHTHASVGRVLGEDNNMADAASRLTRLPDSQFLSHFRTHFPHNKPWRLLTFPSMCNQLLTPMLQNKQSPRGSPLLCLRRKPPPGANGGSSASGSKSSLTSKTLKTPFSSYGFSPSASVPSFCLRTGNLLRIDWLINTSA